MELLSIGFVEVVTIVEASEQGIHHLRALVCR